MKRTFFPTRLQYQAQNALKTCFPASLMAFLVRVKGIIEKKKRQQIKCSQRISASQQKKQRMIYVHKTSPYGNFSAFNYKCD